MDFNKWTTKTQEALQEAQSIASGNGQQAREYRYLLLEVNGPTFFGEIDVYQSE